MNTADGRKGFDKHMKCKRYLWPKYSTLNRELIFTAVNLLCARHRPKYDSVESVISPVARHVVGVLNMEGDPVLLLVLWDPWA